MSLQGQIDTSFQTIQRDLFESGMVAQIGPNAFAIWSAIKAHSEYATGVSWPSIRRLMDLSGLASATVQKATDILERQKLLRKEVNGRRTYYVARERLDVKVGERVLCTIVVDYVPNQLRSKLTRIQNALKTGETDHEAFADVDILPGPGFQWDEKSQTLRASIPTSTFPSTSTDTILSPLMEKVRLLEEKTKSGKKNNRTTD